MASTEQALRCYRHPNVETYVSCSNCERPICTDCMVQTAVGIKCPECAGQPQGVRRATARARTAAGDATGLYVTKALIAINVAAFLVQMADNGTTGGTIERDWALFGPAIADGEWWRVVTSGFLHANLLHIGSNMLMLWWFGGPLEALLGRGRFLAIYGISLLAGAAGAILVTPDEFTLGASGAVFGIFGAILLIERSGIPLTGGAALVVVLLNLVLSFRPGVSVGGHIGGLLGGMLVTFILMHFSWKHPAYSRIDALTVVGLAAVAVGSLLLIWARVSGYA